MQPWMAVGEAVYITGLSDALTLRRHSRCIDSRRRCQLQNNLVQTLISQCPTQSGHRHVYLEPRGGGLSPPIYRLCHLRRGHHPGRM